MKRIVSRIKQRKLANMIVLGFLFVIVLVIALIGVREKNMNSVINLYDGAMIYNSTYSESYFKVIESEGIFEEYVTHKDNVKIESVLEPLEQARKDLTSFQKYDFSGYQRGIKDLEMMVDTCIQNIHSAQENKGLFLIQASDYYRIQKVYRLILRAFEKGWGEQQQFVAELRIETQEQKKIADIRFVILLIIGISIIAFIIYISYQRTNQSITQIIGYAEELKKGNLDIEKLELMDDDEFKPLVDALNCMVIEIKDYLILQKKKNEMELDLTNSKLQKSEIENQLKMSRIKELQSKMNPHFLFNTLNMISCIAFLEHAEKTHRLMEAMGILLRYNIDQKEIIVDVEKEMECITQYVMLQQERFENRIDFQLHVSDECLENPIPALTIQPLVENSVIHGLKDKIKNGFINISVYTKENKTFIEVEDNGCGIKAERLERLMADGENGEGRFGLNAVFKRIRMIYGKDCTIDMQSKENEGTKVTIVIPKDINIYNNLQ